MAQKAGIKVILGNVRLAFGLRLCAIRLALPAGPLPRGLLEACFQEGYQLSVLPENMKIN